MPLAIKWIKTKKTARYFHYLVVARLMKYIIRLIYRCFIKLARYALSELVKHLNTWIYLLYNLKSWYKKVCRYIWKKRALYNLWPSFYLVKYSKYACIVVYHANMSWTSMNTNHVIVVFMWKVFPASLYLYSFIL